MWCGGWIFWIEQVVLVVLKTVARLDDRVLEFPTVAVRNLKRTSIAFVNIRVLVNFPRCPNIGFGHLFEFGLCRKFQLTDPT